MWNPEPIFLPAIPQKINVWIVYWRPLYWFLTITHRWGL